jgi:hypothetical protein
MRMSPMRVLALLFPRLSELNQFLFDRDDPFGTVGAEAWKHCVDVGVHLEEWLDHLAHRSGPWVLGENFAALLHLLHLVAHNDHYRTLAQTVNAGIVARSLQS